MSSRQKRVPQAGTATGAKRSSPRRPAASGTTGPGPDRPGWSPRELLTPYVLLAISTQRMHGYLIEQYLNGLGLAHVEMTTLYRTLRQLEKDGLVRSAWEAGAQGPARRVYTLTEAGRTWLDAGASFLERYRTAIDLFFGAYERPKAPRKERAT